MDLLDPNSEFRQMLDDFSKIGHIKKIAFITAVSSLMLIRTEPDYQTVAWKISFCLGVVMTTATSSVVGFPKVDMDYISLFLGYKRPYMLFIIPILKFLVLRYKKHIVTRIWNRHGEVATSVKEHSLLENPIISGVWEVLATFHIQVIGTTMSLQYVGNPDLNQDVVDQFTAMNEMQDLQKHMGEALHIQFSVFTAFFTLLCLSIGGIPAAAVGISVLLVLKSTSSFVHDNEPATFTTKDLPIGKKNGLYYIKTTSLGVETPRGVAWIDKGTLYTRYHVTNGAGIDTGTGHIAYPSYINKRTDNITYGAPPVYASVMDGQEVTVVMLGVNSNKPIMYRTHVKKTSTGDLVFPGLRSTPGCSGSPVFVEKTREVIGENNIPTLVSEKAYCGSIGWFFDHKPKDIPPDDDRVACEILAEEKGSSNDIPIIHGEVTQYFAHPGSGKTRTVLPAAVRKGLIKYPKVYVTGPTKVVCSEIYKALCDTFPNQVSLLTSSASEMERGSRQRRIVVAAHPTCLSMLVRGSETVRPKGLWIMDEAHFVNSKSMQLKDYLRTMVQERSAGSLLEMTATGWDIRARELVVKDGSNYPIEDITMETEMMLAHLDSNIDEGKSIVFVTSIDGREPTSSVNLQKLYSKYNPVVLNRKTFNDNYIKASDPSTKLILTTDISECGANFDGDKVYDFQMSTKPVRIGPAIYHEKRWIDTSQRVQRRGRIGRTKAGTYISPGHMLKGFDPDRAEYFDREIFARAMKLTIQDQMPSDLDHLPSLTINQIKAWVSVDEKSIESPFLINLLTTPNGNKRSMDEVYDDLISWAKDKRVFVALPKNSKVKDDCRVAFWDSRDSELFHDLAMMVIPNLGDGSNRVAVANAIRRWTRNMRRIITDTTIMDVFPYREVKAEEPESSCEVSLDREETHDD